MTSAEVETLNLTLQVAGRCALWLAVVVGPWLAWAWRLGVGRRAT